MAIQTGGVTNLPSIVFNLDNEDNGIEYPIVVTFYSNCIELHQNGAEINVPYELLDEFLAKLKKAIPRGKSLLANGRDKIIF